MFKRIFFNALTVSAILITAFTQNSEAQKKQYKVRCVGFYNLENLFDTIDSPDTYDYEFLPSGKKAWTSERYRKKLHNMAEVISQIGDEVVKGGPHILGISEVENRNVIEDLIKEPQIINANYGIVHYDSPDERGIDVALIYRKDFFKVIHTSYHNLHFDFDPDDKTRGQLVVTGLFDDDTLNIIVNHWPSRGGGQKASEPKRNAAGDLTRHLVDSIFNLNKNAKIIVMGDLNDNPDNASVVKHLRAKGKINKLKPGDLYSPFYKVYKNGVGTTAYRDAWSFFDQIMLSQSLLSEDRTSYVYWKAGICRKNFMIQQEGKFKGYPKRTFSFDRFQNGYSDHFPTYIFLIKEKK
ncbi:MAG: endonuclease/exonuclease/phosphatase family protein [Chlorobi bacterium]|nr:endonuclease/exonuclease/phosphatase family protein [Chlorobiota bacterium]